jgi:hypothetical protein
VNLAGLASIGASEAGSESRESIGADGLESAGNGGCPGESSPSKGPGETARKEKKISFNN